MKLLAFGLVAACSGGKPKAIEDARKPVVDLRDAAPLGPYKVDPNAKTGDVQVRVEWKNVPPAVRSAPGRTTCGTPHAAAVVPTTTWGIPDVFVSIDVDHGKALAPTRARIVVEPCTITPRVIIAGTSLAIASAAEMPMTVEVRKLSRLPLGGAAIADPGRSVYLPIIGHEVEVGVDPGAVYAVRIPRDKGFDLESSFAVTAEMPYVAITEATGQVVLRDVPVGTHAVRAWLPERAQQPAKLAVGSVTVAAGALAEVTLDLATP